MVASPLAFGETAPDFGELPGIDGRRYSLQTFRDRTILVFAFISNRCPTVKAYGGRMVAFQRNHEQDGVQLVAINSIDPFLYSEESLHEMARRAEEREFNFPYLKDSEQVAGRAFGAVCTPHIFVLDRERRLRYRGRIDDSRDPMRAKNPDLRNAVEDLLQGREVRLAETRPFGCTIDYFH